jgi:type IV pilus assembly protein PilC
MLFSYQVKAKNGRIIKGTLEADNRNLVIENLLKQNYVILEIKEEKPQGKNVEIQFRFLEKVTTKDIALFTRQLSTMIGAGLPIIRCFDILKEQTINPKLKRTAVEIRDDLEAGTALWESIRKHPKVFSEMYVSMVRAGESGGVLDVILDKLANHLERDQEIQAKVKSASTYPIIMVSVAIVVIIFILTFVMPTLTNMFVSANAELPAFTQFFLNLSYFIRSKILFILAFTGLIVFLLKAWAKQPQGRIFFDRLYLTMPLVGRTVNRVAVARFTRTMGLLIKSGVPILQTLEVLEGVVGNKVIANAIARARVSIREGQSIAEPLQQTGVFEAMVIQMITIGEETGRLDEMLERMADFYDREVTYSIDSLMAALEPLLLIIVAVFVGMIILATYLPIFNMIQTIR